MLYSALNFLLNVAQVILLFNILIIVHEWGHFLAARWRGMMVEKFAIWFGKPIWKKHVNGVDYQLGFVPAGGFVALPQMAPMEAMEGKTRLKLENLPPVKPLDKIIVAFAGPLFSFLLALFFALIVWQVGRPVSEAEATTRIGWVEKGSEADKAGIRPGDRVLEVDGKPVTKFMGIGSAVYWRVIRSEGDQIPVRVERAGQILDFSVTPVYEQKKFWQRQPLRQLPFYPGEEAVRVAKTLPNSPARQAGLKPGDRIVAVNGEPVYSRAMVFKAVSGFEGKPIQLTIEREGTQFAAALLPQVPVEPAGINTPMVGIEFATKIMYLYPNPWEQIRSSVNAVFSTLDALLSPKSDVKASHMHGAIGIMNYYYNLFESPEGWKQAFWLSVLINVNLALINLLPIPVLDGGHIVLALVEWIRRKPMNVKILEAVQMTFALLIISYMLYVTFYDLQDLPAPWRKSAGAEIRFAPSIPAIK
jgi:regulator of sigma E protease